MDGQSDLTARQTVGDIVRYWATIQPDAPALVANGQKPLCFGALNACMAGLHHALTEAGLGRGSRVAICHPGGAEMATLLLGVMDGMVAVPMDAAFRPDELVAHIHLCRVDGIIMNISANEAVRDALMACGLPVFEALIEEPELAGAVTLRQAAYNKAPEAHDTVDDLALVLTSNGTTGEAKIIPIRHNHIAARSRATIRLLELTPLDRGLIFNKLFLHGGINHMCASLYAGGSIIVVPQFDTETFFHYLTTLDPTWYVGSFTINKAICEAVAERPTLLKGSPVRMIRITSGAIEPAAMDTLERWFNGHVIEAYATTETGLIAGNPLPPGRRKLGTVGVPFDCEVCVMDDAGKQLPPGETGEVFVKGDNVFDGYENNPETNRVAFFDDWHRTGDLGHFDEDGYLTLTGRIKEMINRGGEKISPYEVDQAMTAHGDVADAAAFAIPHPRLGEVVGAAIVPAPGISFNREELIRFLSQRLNGPKIPCAFYIIQRLPRGPHGKILRQKLAEIFTARTSSARPD